jgi:hypothetical protein
MTRSTNKSEALGLGCCSSFILLNFYVDNLPQNFEWKLVFLLLT